MSEKKVKKLIVICIILSFIIIGLSGYITYDKIKNNDIKKKDILNKEENKNHDSSNKDNSINDKFKSLESTFNTIDEKKDKCEIENEINKYNCIRTYYEDFCREKLQGNYCRIFDLDASEALYFISNDVLYLGDINSKKLYVIEGLEGVPIKVTVAHYSSDASIPVVAVLTRNGNGYLASTDTAQRHDIVIDEIRNFIKIESEQKLHDIIFLQNYEVMSNSEEYIIGSAIPFVKFGSDYYTWKKVKQENINGKVILTLGDWLQDLK